MFSSYVLTALVAVLFNLAPTSLAVPTPVPQSSSSGSSAYWFGDPTTHSNSIVWGHDPTDSSYALFRNVRNYGAVGDGVTDDTVAINKAMTAGARCVQGCNSSSTAPAIVYIPAGTYKVSKPIIMPYFTQVVGDALNKPTLLASSDFKGMAVLDSDPYDNYGNNWYINQNNFNRQVRNLIIDISGIADGSGAGIHWQVAQATSLQNIVFNMKKGVSTQSGIFMDNGSGGFMSDLVFNGGKYGAFFGSQQFTARNMVFNNSGTAIFMNWNWGWTLHNITINGNGITSGSVGLDMSNSPTNQTVGSVMLADSIFWNVQYGIKSSYKKNGNVPETGGTLIVDNVELSNTGSAIVDSMNNEILPKGHVTAWASGNVYSDSTQGTAVQGSIQAPIKDPALLSNNYIFARSKPQYENVPLSGFWRSKTDGKCMGDGTSDDTVCLQNFLNAASQKGLIAYIEYGAYIVTDTIKVPTTIKIVGEIWPMIVASGFNDAQNPKPVWQVGAPTGEKGSVEISDLVFMIRGPNPGAIMLQWNLNSAQGASGVWDTHARIGGSYGSKLQFTDCKFNPAQTSANPNCVAAFMMLHIGKQASNAYFENTWFWTADHDFEDPLNRQISVYNARGVLVQAAGAVWLWGTASEHSFLYNYQFDGAQRVFAGFIQSETPYYQPNPSIPQPFTFNTQLDDPQFSVCNNSTGPANVPCKDAWGLRILNSKNILIYSLGMYSFFNNYDQGCVIGQNCQQNMIHITNSQVSMYAVTTKAAINMIVDDSFGNIKNNDNMDVFGATVAYFTSTH